MSYPFGEHSRRELLTAVEPLQRVFNKVSEFRNCSILDGVRSVEQQKLNVAHGLSKTMDSKHLPNAEGKSEALDVAPYPQRWDDSEQIRMTTWEVDQVYFAGFVMGIAAMLGVELRYGGDWNSDDAKIGTGFRDLDHFEVKK